MTGKAKPTNLKLIQGNPGKRKLPENTPQPRVEVLPAPAWLNSYAKEVWDAGVDELIRLGMLSVLDYPIFTAFCISAAEARYAYEKIVGVDGEDGEGRTYAVEGRNGRQLKTNPRIPQLREWVTVMRQTGSELGMSPVSRVRLTGVAQGELPLTGGGHDSGNEFDEFG